ncbi:hypothetical protein V5O48_007669, partial [Marasmius crinis-equi]
MNESSTDMGLDCWTESFASESHSKTEDIDTDIENCCKILEKSTLDEDVEMTAGD